MRHLSTLGRFLAVVGAGGLASIVIAGAFSLFFWIYGVLAPLPLSRTIATVLVYVITGAVLLYALVSAPATGRRSRFGPLRREPARDTEENDDEPEVEPRKVGSVLLEAGALLGTVLLIVGLVALLGVLAAGGGLRSRRSVQLTIAAASLAAAILLSWCYQKDLRRPVDKIGFFMTVAGGPPAILMSFFPQQ